LKVLDVAMISTPSYRQLDFVVEYRRQAAF
jgi:hypothetical protein